DGQSLTIYEREFHALLGPSGCGKTTLLRMLAGFEEPTEGSIWLDGKPLSGVPPHKRPVNMMFQSYALFPHMSVRKNVAFGLRQDRLPKGEVDERVAEILKLVRMEQFAGRAPHQLSGGQRQRVALARSLVKRPKLLLLDEPLAALDKKLREHTQFELINIQETLGVTFVVVTHDQEEAMTLASRIGVMNHGGIAQVGTPSEIYEFPATRFVADFIGSVNMFEGRLIEDEPDYVRVASDELGGTFHVGHGVSAAPDAIVWVALRPEKIEISRERPEGNGDNRIQGAVSEIAYRGDQSVYLVRLAGGRQVRVTRPNTLRQDAGDRIRWDDPVWLSWDSSSPVVVTQ
ncbi:MAG: ABC transporter ATP-binding protein, partial [Steroidobacteraceae bacterium]